MESSTHADVLVSTDWLAAHLGDPQVRIVESDLSPEGYFTGHIPGAVFWDVFADLLTPSQAMNLDPSAFAALMGRSGISRESTVVVYSAEPGVGGWLFWLLKAFGHADVRVLNGGRRKWLAEGRPLEEEPPTPTPTAYVPEPTSALRATIDEVRWANRDRVVLVDARTPQEYRGEWFFMAPPRGAERAGRIPGAVSVPHDRTVGPDGTIRPDDELRALFAEAGVTPDKAVICYCAVGARAGHLWFVLKHLLAYPDVRSYDGSWVEWSRQPEAMIEV